MNLRRGPPTTALLDSRIPKNIRNHFSLLSMESFSGTFPSFILIISSVYESLVHYLYKESILPRSLNFVFCVQTKIIWHLLN